MLGGYRRTFGPEHVVELSKNITVQHDDYLKQDDPDKKVDALRYMAVNAAQYLHLVPHEKKFTFMETERVLHNSAMNIGDFDPREGSLSFKHLAKYAENLMEQPWRTDFHIIKLTSGFYVHNIAAQLSNAHEILIAMGYVNISDTTLKLLPNRDFNNLKNVSRDCYIASQECLILSQIWQHVADQEPDYPLTIGEVFEYRKNHLGDTDTICNKLLFDIRSRMHLVKKRQIQQYQHSNQSVQHLKHSQQFVPVDRLIDYDTEDRLSVDEPDNLIPHTNQNFIPEREVERTQALMKNVSLHGFDYSQEDEHIYDPVYGSSEGDSPCQANTRKQDQLQTLLLQQTHRGRHPPTQSTNLQPSNNLPGQYHYNSINTGKNINTNSKMSRTVLQNVSEQFPPYNYTPHLPEFQNDFNSSVLPNNLMYEANDGRNSMSPMIPKTVSSMFSNSNGLPSRNSFNKSNSMNSISGKRESFSSPSSPSDSTQKQPLTKSKIKETDLDADLSPVHQSPSKDTNRYHYFGDNFVGTTANSSNMDICKQLRSAKTVSAIPTVSHLVSGAIQKTTQNQCQVYPDEYYPRIVKPVPVYGSPAANSQLHSRTRINSNNSDDDVLNQALMYASEVNQMSKGNSSVGNEDTLSRQNYQHQATPIPMPVSDSDSNSYSSECTGRVGNLRREMVTGNSRLSLDVSSTRGGPLIHSNEAFGPASSNVNALGQRRAIRKSEPLQRPTHIDLHTGGGSSRKHDSNLRYADSSPEDLVPTQPQHQLLINNKNGYKELSSSSSSGGSPASASARCYPRNEELNSLDTVYYDYLLKKGETDEVMGNNSVYGSKTQQESRSTSKVSSHHHQSKAQPHQNHFTGSELEENHIYDGRRVLPKKRQDQNLNSKRSENDQRRRNSQTAVESSPPGPSYSAVVNNEQTQPLDTLNSFVVVNKPSKEKNVRRSAEVEEKVPVESEAPDDSSSTIRKVTEPWDCRFCTFRNLTAERICEMCAKSKDFYEEDAVMPTRNDLAMPKLFSVPQVRSTASPKFGIRIAPNPDSINQGRINNNNAIVSSRIAAESAEEDQVECPQCTLLNPRRAKTCDACAIRLKPVESPRNVEEAYDIR